MKTAEIAEKRGVANMRRYDVTDKIIENTIKIIIMKGVVKE